jgi:(p)ppGpp synthase/HD superfamily hydrolase
LDWSTLPKVGVDKLTIVDKARYFATAAHAAVGQKRKYSDDDYIVHPIRVANLVKQYGGTEEMIAAAYLHDVVEDTDVTMDTITSLFGSVVASLVKDLTDVSKPSDGNREARKTIDRLHTADASADAQFIKCADIMDNAWDIADNDPSFWKVYQREMSLLLDEMSRVRGTDIWNQAQQAIAQKKAA